MAETRAELIAAFLDYIERAGSQSVRTITKRVLEKSRELTRAEAGTIFTVAGTGKKQRLQARDIQNDRIRVRQKDIVVPLDHSSIAGHVAMTGKTVMHADVYDLPEGTPYAFNPAFDRASGYRTQSVMAFPLRTVTGRIIGVVQLINRLGTDGSYTAFTPAQEAIIDPANHIVGRIIERALMLETIRGKNDKLRERNRRLADQRRQIAALQAETEEAFRLSVNLLGRAAELQDRVTGDHIVRVGSYAQTLARLAGQPKAFCDEIHYAAQLHDIGKMSVDQGVLQKKTALSEEDFEEIKRHTWYGYEILKDTERLKMAAEIALCHHEKWDGTGYPQGLAGEAIPLPARIVALADIYDALRAPRPYKDGFDHHQTVAIMREGDARLDPTSHFDPRLLALFCQHSDIFDAIWQGFDADPAAQRYGGKD